MVYFPHIYLQDTLLCFMDPVVYIYVLLQLLYIVHSGLNIMLGTLVPADKEGGRRSPAVACWASDHWVAISNPLRGKFPH